MEIGGVVRRVGATVGRVDGRWICRRSGVDGLEILVVREFRGAVLRAPSTPFLVTTSTSFTTAALNCRFLLFARLLQPTPGGIRVRRSVFRPHNPVGIQDVAEGGERESSVGVVARII